VSAFAGLDLLATAVVALDDALVVRYANPAAENLFATGAKSLIGHPFLALFSERAELELALDEARVTHWDYSAQNVTYARPGREPHRPELRPCPAASGSTVAQSGSSDPSRCRPGSRSSRSQIGARTPRTGPRVQTGASMRSRSGPH